MYDSTIKLVKRTITANEYGDHVVTETVRTVFADVGSIRQSEFYQAAAVGMMPEIMFTLADYLDYEDEKIVKYQPRGASEELEYAVQRAYWNKKTNEMEIICKRGID